MSVTVVMTDTAFAQIWEATRRPVETAAVILTRPVAHPRGTRLLVHDLCWVENDSYAEQSAFALSIRSEGYVHALSRAERDGCVPIWFHTHPGLDSSPRPSSHDAVVDAQIADLFRLRASSPYYGSLIVAAHDQGISFTGFIEDDSQVRQRIDKVWSVGDRLRLTLSHDAPESGLSPAFDRSVRAFGPAVQRTLAALHFAVVGCGGTGSALAEQLVRLGARHMLLIDVDVLSQSNVTRVYGSIPESVGQPKVTVLEAHLRRIAPDANIDSVQGMVTHECIAEHLIGCDLIFGCTDDNAGRLVLSRLASYLLTPVIDCGVLLSSNDDGLLIGIDGRVTTLVPGQACLVCRNRVDVARAASELMTPDERARRVEEGYAPALGRVEPAVVTYTTTVAAFAVSELLERLIGFGPEPRPSEILFRGHEREISTNRAAPREGHYCDLSAGKVGLGLTTPLFEQTWPGSV